MDDVSSNDGELAMTTDGNEPSLEELQTELAELEAAELELADRLAGPQLDHQFAEIEEQFRDSFDDRLRAASSASSSSSMPIRFQSTDVDLLQMNRVFRDVSRLMADEWRPVFDQLTAGFDTQIVDEEKRLLDLQPRLIQGYKALLKWKQLCGDQFDILQLMDVLRRSDMEDIAEVAQAALEKQETDDKSKKKSSKPVQRRKSDVTSESKSKFLDNRRMLLLAKKVGNDWEPLGRALGVAEEELTEIRQDQDGSSYHGAFKMLWSWRQTVQSDELSDEKLRSALQNVNRAHLIDQIAAN